MIDNALITELGGKPSHSVEEVTRAVNIAVGSSAAVTLAKDVSERSAAISEAAVSGPATPSVNDRDLVDKIQVMDAPTAQAAEPVPAAPAVEVDEPSVDGDEYDGPDIG